MAMARMRRVCLASAVRAAAARNCEILRFWRVISIADMLPAPRINDVLHRVTLAAVWESPQESGSQAVGIRGLDGLLPPAEEKEDQKQAKATTKGEKQAGTEGFFKIVCGKTGKFELSPFRMELCAGGSVVWLGIKGSFSFLYGVRLCGNQFRDAAQVVRDELQQASCGDTSNPAFLSLAHHAMLLAPAKDAFDHFAALLRHAIARVPCRAGIDRASPPLADFGRAIVLPTCGVTLMARRSSTWPFVS